jgi:hypothetical protein
VSPFQHHQGVADQSTMRPAALHQSHLRRCELKAD